MPRELTEAPAAEAKPAEPAKPAETAAPTESAKPAEPAKPAETAAPAETSKPAEAAKPAEPPSRPRPRSPPPTQGCDAGPPEEVRSGMEGAEGGTPQERQEADLAKFWSSCNKRLKDAGE